MGAYQDLPLMNFMVHVSQRDYCQDTRLIKIAVIAPKYGLLGGAERFVYELTERLSRVRDFSIDVFSSEWSSENRSITFHKTPKILFPRFLRPVFFAYLAKWFASASYDLVHSHERVFEMDLMTMHGIPHKTWIKKVRHKPLSLFDRCTAWVEKKGFTTNAALRVMPVSTLAETEILKLYPTLKGRVRVVHPGIAPEKFNNQRKKEIRGSIRKMHGFSSRDTVMLFVGMNFEIKRLDLILKSMSVLQGKTSQDSRLKLLVVGNGNSKRYLRMANQLQIAAHVIFVGPSEDVESYYFAGDMLAMPSQFDTFGMVVLEAMAAGLPPIITKSVGASDLVEDGVHGLVMEKEPSVSDMAHALQRLLDPVTRGVMAEKARSRVSKETWESRASEVEKIYRQIIEEKALSQ
jgi:UDP-glucose:(heptosyl)LPS alpha-1,3-glucosyltransferase